MKPHICYGGLYFQIMDSNVNVVDCETLSRKNKQKIVWTNATFMTFVNACLDELRKGNRHGAIDGTHVRYYRMLQLL